MNSLLGKKSGTVAAVGNNLDGQCNVEIRTDIVQIVTIDNATIGLKSDRTVISTANIYPLYGSKRIDYSVKETFACIFATASADGDVHTVLQYEFLMTSFWIIFILTQ